MVGMIIGLAVLGGVGVLLIVLGLLLWRKEKITLMHNYHVDKVSAENRAAYCRLAGIGVLIIGIGLAVSAVVLGVTGSLKSFLFLAAVYPVGLGFLIAAGRKYNR